MILQEWESYRKEVMHKDCQPEQLFECRRAFYAGAISSLAIYDIGAIPHKEEIMAELLAELRAFKDQLLKGEA
jgi:hypothetical protein